MIEPPIALDIILEQPCCRNSAPADYWLQYLGDYGTLKSLRQVHIGFQYLEVQSISGLY